MNPKKEMVLEIAECLKDGAVENLKIDGSVIPCGFIISSEGIGLIELTMNPETKQQEMMAFNAIARKKNAY